MSLGVAIKGPEGIVLACDSRVTLTAHRPGTPPLPVNFDNATKLLTFAQPHNHVGAVTYGAAVIGLRTAQSYLPELMVKLETLERLTVEQYATFLSEFFLSQWKQIYQNDTTGQPVIFIVGGYDRGDTYGKVFIINIPRHPEPAEQNIGETNFGMTWGGQLEVASRLIHGFDPRILEIIKQRFDLNDSEVNEFADSLKPILEYMIPYQVLPLQDCVDLATLMIQTTMNMQDLAVAHRGVGGPIELATITRIKGLDHILQKKIRVRNAPRGEI